MSSRSSTTDFSESPPMPDGSAFERVLVGRVGRPHGVRGELTVQVESDNPRRFEPGSVMIAELSSGGSRHLMVEASRPHRGGVVLRFAGVADRQAAQGLSGAKLTVSRQEIPPAPQGEVYHFELIGCRCSDRHSGDLGEVVDVVEDGGGLLLVVSGPQGVVPIPFVQAFIDELNLDSATLRVTLPDGLLEACASTS